MPLSAMCCLKAASAARIFPRRPCGIDLGDQNKLFPLGDDVAFVPGHGPMSTFGRERRTILMSAQARNN
jgi:hypothetical protein